MDHAITIGGLMRFLLGTTGLAAVVIGALIFMGGAMSDAPAEGESAGKIGCIVMAVGIAVFGGAVAFNLF